MLRQDGNIKEVREQLPSVETCAGKNTSPPMAKNDLMLELLTLVPQMT